MRHASLGASEQDLLKRVAANPFYLVRKELQLDFKQEDALYDLLDSFRRLSAEALESRTTLVFEVDLATSSDFEDSIHNADFRKDLIFRQNESGHRLVYQVDLSGQVTADVDCQEEVERDYAVRYSQTLQRLVIFISPKSLNIYVSGKEVILRSKIDALRESKSARRDALFDMRQYREFMPLYFEKQVKGQPQFWHIKNKKLRASPEVLFQADLHTFLLHRISWSSLEKEYMFGDQSRCDIRVLTPEEDLYFIEIKWIGSSVGGDYDTDRATGGAVQTLEYIVRNSSLAADQRVTKGIFTLFDARTPPADEIEYSEEVQSNPLLDCIHFKMVVDSPSTIGDKAAAQKKKRKSDENGD